MSLEYSVDYFDQMKLIEERLGTLRGKSKDVLREAINDTARNVKKTMLEKARERYAESDPAVLANKQLKLTTAKADGLTAVLRSRGKSLDMPKFSVFPHAPQQRTTVTAKILEENGMKAISGEPKPFLVQFKNGHLAVLRRVPGEEYGMSNAGMIRRLLGWDITKVKKLVTVSTPQMLHEEEVTDSALDLFQTMLPDAVGKSIRKAIKKGG